MANRHTVNGQRACSCLLATCSGRVFPCEESLLSIRCVSFYSHILVHLVIYDSGKVSLKHLLLSWYPSLGPSIRVTQSKVSHDLCLVLKDTALIHIRLVDIRLCGVLVNIIFNNMDLYFENINQDTIQSNVNRGSYSRS